MNKTWEENLQGCNKNSWMQQKIMNKTQEQNWQGCNKKSWIKPDEVG